MKDEGIIKDAYELIIKELQTLVTIFYLMLIGVGMVFNFFKYSAFGINIFEYATIFDFLIAPFQDKIIIIFTIFACFWPYVGYKMDIWQTRKFPKFSAVMSFGASKRSWYPKLQKSLFLMMLIGSLILFASLYGNESKKHIMKNPTLNIEFINTEVERGIQIGKIHETIFLLQKEEGDELTVDNICADIYTVKAIPINPGVKTIQIIK